MLAVPLLSPAERWVLSQVSVFEGGFTLDAAEVLLAEGLPDRLRREFFPRLVCNALFLEVYDLIRQMRREAGWRERREETNVPGFLRLLGQQHQHIFDAIAAGDAAGAGQAQRDHLDFVASAIDSD
ncbi:MAG TPA: FCD domain-containing protein [Paracoccus sp.]|nr:FCD domain-containing protein [Paracoccus sp. (in: a-proteobacteria)]